MRYPSIDMLRTIAIGIMVVVHFVENLSGQGQFTPFGFAAPLFAFLVGVSYSLWLGGQQARGKSDEEITKVTIRRGLFLIGVGFLFNVLVWLPEDVFNWDVLTFLGAALIFLNVARAMPAPIRLLTCLVIYGLSPLLRQASSYADYWTLGYFDPDLTLADVLLGFLVNGYFPIFPWLIFPVAGYTVGAAYFPAARREPSTESALLAVGALLLAVALAAVWLRRFGLIESVWIQGWTMFPASLEYTAGALGGALLALVLTHRAIDASPLFAPEAVLGHLAGTMSRHSFTLYLLHHIAHIWPLWLYGMWAGGEATAYWQKALPATVSWPLAIGFLVAGYFLLRWMDQRRFSGVEGLMRWLCD